MNKTTALLNMLGMIILNDVVDKGVLIKFMIICILWESTWLLELKVKKCKVLHTSFNNNPYNTYHLKGKVMLTSDQEKDLGVLTTCNLLWND